MYVYVVQYSRFFICSSIYFVGIGLRFPSTYIAVVGTANPLLRSSNALSPIIGENASVYEQELSVCPPADFGRLDAVWRGVSWKPTLSIVVVQPHVQTTNRHSQNLPIVGGWYRQMVDTVLFLDT
jgi:hypothetical protein